MFRGINPINLDVKGRVALPAKYRARVTDRCDGHMVVTVHPFDRCLLLYPLVDWELIESQVNALPNSSSRQARRLQHLMVGYATEVDLDARPATGGPRPHTVDPLSPPSAHPRPCTGCLGTPWGRHGCPAPLKPGESAWAASRALVGPAHLVSGGQCAPRVCSRPRATWSRPPRASSSRGATASSRR